METNRRTAICGIACALLLTFPILAHHSTGLFDQSQVISQVGTVNEVEWINPHTWLHVDVADENGNVARWSFEGGSPRQLIPLGWSVDDLPPGTEITVGFRPMRDGSRGGQLMSVTLPDGRQLCSNRGCG
ncbi:MAG: DUF6152 family protein [Planctomycetota bacterium]|nr:DUF6152 family protein [Planctomycetota bacterium]